MCVLFLQKLGKVLGLTYPQISVVFNLWIQGGVLVFSALLPTIVYIVGAFYYLFHGGRMSSWDIIAAWILFFILLGYALMYVWFYALIFRHYGKSYYEVFDKCVLDLQRVANVWHCSYQLVNLMIFVGFFSILVGINLVLTALIMMMPM